MNRKAGEAKTGVLAGILVAIIAFCAVMIFRDCDIGEETFDVQAFGGYGAYAAERVMEHLGPEKSVVAIVFDESAAILHGKDHYAFVELLKANRYKVKVVEVSPGALLSDPSATDYGVLSIEEYQAIVSKYADKDLDAIISLAGAPVPVPDPPPPAPEGAPPLIIAQPIGPMSAELLVESGFADMAILANANRPSMNALPVTTDDFSYFYEVIVAP